MDISDSFGRSDLARAMESCARARVSTHVPGFATGDDADLQTSLCAERTQISVVNNFFLSRCGHTIDRGSKVGTPILLSSVICQGLAFLSFSSTCPEDSIHL